MSLVELIFKASLIEQSVLLLLLVISVICWAMILQRAWLIKSARHTLEDFESVFWSGKDLNKLYLAYKPILSANSGIQNVFYAGFHEFRRLDAQTDVEVLIVSIQRVMRIAIAKEQDHLSRHLTTLASFGSLAPYVGLFGTVIGIMNAFLELTQGGGAQATLASIAPGIAEALIATAMGLIAAIPALWAYNAFSARVNNLLDSYETFTEEFISILNRKIRQRGTTPPTTTGMPQAVPIQPTLQPQRYQPSNPSYAPPPSSGSPRG